MLLCINVLLLLLLQLALSSPVPLTTPSRGCPTCKPNDPMQTQASEASNSTAPGVGGQCGVYTLSCALGLRCAPPPGEPRPLRALLEGRGVCTNATITSPTPNTHLADPATEDPNEGPCRRLLTTLIKGLDAHLFDSQHDIYMPNCDKRGFFRKKQCWSSRGKRRGQCWCVDPNGMQVSLDTGDKGTLAC